MPFFNKTGGLLLQTVLFIVNNTKNEVDNYDVINNEIELASKAVTLEQIRKGEDMGLLCYEQLGCYSVKPPWTDESRPVSHYPEHPDKVAPVFCLFTLSNPDTCQVLQYNDTQSIYKSHLIPTLKIFMITHGFLESGDKPWIELLKKKLLHRKDCNVITVDWHGGSSPPYTQAVANIRLVGTIAARLIHTLHITVGVKPEFVHLIGHSLGAHLSGYVGNVLQRWFNLTLGRISGLDPAEPHFSKTDPIVRLDPTDAIFVDIIHTDTTPFIKGGLGMDEPIGHLDFYPNGGEDQAGCNHSISTYMDLEEGSFIKGLRRFLGCDHTRSYRYFIESISSECQYIAIECDSYENFLAGKCFKCRNEMYPNGRLCARMGYHSLKIVQKEGGAKIMKYPTANRTMVQLYTLTAPQHPFCRALYRVTVTISNSKESIEHKGDIGTFSVVIDGINGRTEELNLFREQHYKPGNKYTQVVAGKQVGRIRSATIRWKHEMKVLNILTWRLTKPFIHLGKVVIDNLEQDFSVTLCADKEEFFSKEPREMKPCGDVRPIVE